MSRVLLLFAKTDKARFIGHLDLIRVFQRAINRANLPAAYSGGFNPHQKLAFAVPLALGMDGRNEAAELELTGDSVSAADIMDRLNAAMPKGLLIHAARFMEGNEESAAALAVAACYEMRARPPDNLAEKVRELIARKSVVISKKTKNGVMDTDIRPDIVSLEVFDDTLRAVLSAGGQRGLRPDLLAGALGVSICQVTRVNVYKTVNGVFKPLFYTF
ncbi:MAG: TIGR03936 family radical SAM-associated protein [Clostridiales bacterium]|jgi:radical SAM-linked protein|nr:TIGR03936 family radical SAM-associated protein [Clostridiales bacterium]